MPLYEYICQECGERFEKLIRGDTHGTHIVCPSCASVTVKRAFSTFATNGGSSEALLVLSTAAVGEVWSGRRFSMNTTSDFHTYRLVVLNQTYTIYVDGIARLSGPTRALNRSGIFFGDGSLVSGGDALWDCIALTIAGAFSPAQLLSPACDAPAPVLFPIDGTAPGFPASPYAYAGGAYVNMIVDEGQEMVKTAYRDNYARLAQIKAKYDPNNLFHVNQNIKPAV